jgi:predicted HicB family RNase H-like nuclease
MVTLSKKKSGTNNQDLQNVLNEAKKEAVTPLHVQLPESLMKRLRIYAVEQDKSLRDVVIEALEAKI